MNKINLGKTDKDGILFFRENLMVIDNMPLKVTFEVEGTTWNSAILKDSKQHLRCQILEVGSSEWYQISALAEETSPQSVPGTIIGGDWIIEGVICASANTEVIFYVNQGHEGLNVNDLTSWISEDMMITSDNQIRHIDSPRWVKCDLHTHTTMSDGKMTIEDNQEQAKKMELDFYVATDHNITPSMWKLSDNLPVVFPGVEVTSPLGHFNLLFANDFIFKYHPISDMETKETFFKMIETIHQLKMGLFSINHPFLTVWKWLLEDLPLAWIDSIEIINDPTYAANVEANWQTLKFWTGLLSDGHKISIIGGSDSHLLPDERYDDSCYPSVIGDPGTYVYTEEISVNSISKAIKSGHVIVSRFGKLDVRYDKWLPGETIHHNDLDRGLRITADYNCQEDIATNMALIVNGEVVHETNMKQLTFHLSAEDIDSEYSWIRIQVMDQITKALLAVSNPLYIGSKEPTLITWKDGLKRVPDSTPDE